MSSQLFPPVKSLSGYGPFFTWPSAAAILILILAGPFGSRAAVTDSFIRLTAYPSGGSPARTVSADFNRDGKFDVVVLNTNGVLSLLPGSGNGAFGAPRTIATLPPFSAVPLLSTGDFNGDGAPDIAILASPGNAVEVFLGHGDGTFAAAVSMGDGLSSAGDMATGDFNGDGKADIAVTGSTSIAVLMGNSVGIFAKPIVTVTNLTASGSLVLALGDVNSDSHLDAVVTDQNRGIQVLLGNGSGTFNPKAVFSFFDSPNGPNTLAIADFNGDGKPDLVAGVGAELPEFFLAQVCLLFGYGDGTFNQTPSCYNAPILAGGRVDKSGFEEMLVTNLNGSAGLVFPADPEILLINDGSGVLSQASYAAGGGPVTLGDFNGDGRQDIAVSNADGVQLLLNLGSGLLRAPLSLTRIGSAFNQTLWMNTTDFNYDGFADLALTEFFNEHGGLTFAGTVSLGSPRNQFTTSANVSLPFLTFESFVWSVTPPAIGDFNHDGYLDIAYSGISDPDHGENPTTFAQILFGDGKGNFPTQGPALSLSSNFLAAGYFNGDGYADLASLDGSTFEILIGKGDGTFAAPVPYTVGTNPVFVMQRDLNGDGKKDVIVVNHDSSDLSVLLGKGDGTFQPQKRFATGTVPLAAVTGDFNRDGKVDIAVASSAGASILLGNGDGTFQPQKTYSAGGPMTGIVQASVRQDGLECLIGIDSATQRFTLLPGIGDGTFGAPVFFPVHRIPTAIVAADFNHDGATDIVLLDDEDLVVFYNQGGDQVALASSSTAPKAGQSVTFTAHVTAGFGELGAPTGKVTFKDGARYLGNVALQSGTAHLTTQLSAGTHQILAEYGGDSTFNPNHSATVFISVAP